MNKKIKWYLVAALVIVFMGGMGLPVAAEDPCDAVCRVEARIAELRATYAARYAASMAASEARIAAMLARIEAERAARRAEHLVWMAEVDAEITAAYAMAVPGEIPCYSAPIILSPGPNDVYGNRSRATIDVRGDLVPIMGIDAVTGDPMPTGDWEYEWHTETIAVPSGGGVFRWTWEGTLGPDEYFQVQLICPNGSHRGIHPPTKDLLTVQGGGLRYVVQDCKGAKTRAWDHESWTPVRNIPIEWTVAIVRWDGVDPSRIGATLAEAEARWLRI